MRLRLKLKKISIRIQSVTTAESHMLNLTWKNNKKAEKNGGKDGKAL